MKHYQTVITPETNWLWLVGLSLLVVGVVSISITAYLNYRTKKINVMLLVPSLVLAVIGMTLFIAPIAATKSGTEQAAQTTSKALAEQNHWELKKWSIDSIKSIKADYAVTARYKETYCKISINETKSYKPWQPGATYNVDAYCIPDLGLEIQKELEKIQKLPKMRIFPR